MSPHAHRIVACLRFVWNGPSDLPTDLESEWRLVVIRWVGIAFMLPSIGLLQLPPTHVPWAYALLWIACIYNGLAQRSLRRTHRLFLNGYFTTVGDALLNVAMVTLGGGFGTPLYFLLFTVTIAAAMRFGYGPAGVVTATFVGADFLEQFVGTSAFDGAFLLRSGFLVLTGVLASYLREQARRAERALECQLEHAQHEALHDALTGLPNRKLLAQRLDTALDRSADGVAVLYLDLDHLKEINNTFGHRYGDLLLKESALRLASVVPPKATLARLSGDEFAVVLPGADRSSAADLAKRLMEAVARPLELDSIAIDVTVSIGIALAPEDGTDADVLQRRADVAMYVAKTRRDDYAFYAPEQDHDSREQIELAADLRRAIERNELFLQYQPIVAIESGDVVEVEALIRWAHPTRGLVSPAQFIPLAEETGAILPIGQWVMREACEEAARWHRLLPSGAAPRISINVSARQFQHSDVVGDVGAALADTKLAADKLKVEITETVAMADPEMTIASLWSLRGMGVHIAIDDFGTGYSSLGYLKRFPADTLKIDKLFIDGLGVHPEDSAIVAATIAFARAVGLSTTAEGVESAEQAADLRALGVDRVQGYFYSRPLSSGDMLALLRRGAFATRDAEVATAA